MFLIRLEGGDSRGYEAETSELFDYLIRGNEQYEFDREEGGYHVYRLKGRYGKIITMSEVTEKKTLQGKRFGVV